MDPFLGIHAAVTRRKPGERHEGYIPEEKLSVTEAVELFTTGSAAAAGEEGERGSIEVGKYADFTVVDRMIHNDMDPDDLLKIKVCMTVVNGEVGYMA